MSQARSKPGEVIRGFLTGALIAVEVTTGASETLRNDNLGQWCMIGMIPWTLWFGWYVNRAVMVSLGLADGT